MKLSITLTTTPEGATASIDGYQVESVGRYPQEALENLSSSLDAYLWDIYKYNNGRYTIQELELLNNFFLDENSDVPSLEVWVDDHKFRDQKEYQHSVVKRRLPRFLEYITSNHSIVDLSLPFYDWDDPTGKWENIERRAFRDLDKNGPEGLEWILFCEAVKPSDARRKIWEETGLLPSDYKSKLKEIEENGDILLKEWGYDD